MSPTQHEPSAQPSAPARSPLARQQARRRRQTITFLGLFGFVLLLGLIAYGNWAQWWTIGGRGEPVAVACPVQVVSAPNLTVLNVYNGTDRSGLAAAVAKEMQKRGFHVQAIQTVPEPTPVTGVATISYGPSGQVAAHTVALQFPGPVKLVKDKREGSTVDVLIGKKYRGMVLRSKALAAIAPKREPVNCVPPSASPTPEVA